ncbi:Uncharacterised protein [Starkeya nomas]|uniref:Uncharacterized protein n=1 Tax=Starkeya nomas TaxID=2666134 RepID=A0A5S9NAA3_9HYPH|nr:hypothetical protein [Starkeya nomas]CAA0086888.1 Uncharacterised protein [Starkeya nomas]
MSFPTRLHTLSRSKVVVTIPADWHVSDTQASQRYGKGDVVKTQAALLQRVCLFNGEKWPIDDIQTKITGKDYTELLGELYSDEEAEGAEGNG